MGEKKARILAIAPYEALHNSIIRLAKSREDISVDAYVGNMKEGVEIARFHENDGYDVIISRGATARLLREAVRIPVIAVEFSDYDILRAIRLAENYPYRYAVCGSLEITKRARVLCDLLQKKIEIVTLYHQEDADRVLRELKWSGISMVICGTVGEDAAKKVGLSSFMILSGDECIEAAFDQAIEMSRGYAYMRERKMAYESIFRREKAGILLLYENGEIYFSNGPKVPKELQELLRKSLDSLPDEGIKKIQAVKNTFYEIDGSWIQGENGRYAYFRIQEQKIAVQTGRQGISFSDKKQAENYYYDSFFGSSGALGFMEEKINALAKIGQPTLILGESGCGKEQIARYLYIHSVLCNHPFITVDCDALNDKVWAYLISGASSPFGETGQTYFFQKLDKLSENRQKQLYSLILERGIHQHSRIIAACVTEKGGQPKEAVMRILNYLPCVKIWLPPLRERKEEIPMLASLYLAKKNRDLSKQILGFEPGAVELLRQYDWPENYTQLKRVLDELASITETSYISSLYIRQFLEEENKIYACSREEKPFDFERTLDEINRDIISQVLEKTKGNQTAAAKKLGISRSTLWRLLK